MNRNSVILIVDDEESARDTLEALLASGGYDLKFAIDGPSGLEMAKETRPDLVLLDVMMPGMDGFEVCRKLREMEEINNVPIVLVTALDDQDSKLRGIEAGADDFVSKPYDTTELRARVKTITRLDRYRRTAEEQNKFKWVISNSEEAYLILGENSTIQYANRQARRYLHLSEDEDSIVDITFDELVLTYFNLQPSDSWNTTEDLLRPGDAPRYLVRRDSPTAQPVWLRADVLEVSGSSTDQIVLRLTNVTDDIAKQRMMWSFHFQVKLRTPMTSLTWFIDLLNEFRESPEDILTFINEARKNAINLQDRVRAIFEYVDAPMQMQNGSGACRVSTLSSVASDVARNLEIASIRVETDGIVPDETARIGLTARQLELVMAQLFENAHKFHPDGTPDAFVSISLHDDVLRITVTDDGQHVPPEHLDLVWIPYFQAEKYFTGNVPGMGLGLSTVAAMVWEAGGSCRMRNREDRDGVIVELEFPLIREPRSTEMLAV
jgi:two-component system, cell cycle response regulator